MCGFICFKCCISAKDSNSDLIRKAEKTGRKEKTCRGSCGIGFFLICETSTKENFNFSCKKSSKEKRGMCHFSYCASLRKEEEVKGFEKSLKKKTLKKKVKSLMCCNGCCSNNSSEEKKFPEFISRCESLFCLYKRKGIPSIKKRKKGFRLCCGSKQKEDGRNHLVSLVHNLSFKSDSGGRNRFNKDEILRLGNINIASRVFTYKELLAATNSFKVDCLLGSGGFGRVYKGKIAGMNEVVAVKKLDRRGYQGSREFLIEVLMLGLLHHPNLVKLLGYCAEGNHRILVYEYMPFGSLQDHLYDILSKNKPLDWLTRMKIATGVAKGLEHLHDEANPPVIYRDMKASNILLNENYCPKLSDFGLAKLGPTGDNTHVSTRIMGTYGYCAPEYALTGQLTKMSDVYSFGVLLLEIITGRKAIDTTRPKDEQHLALWAETLYKDKKNLVGMADPLLNGNFSKKSLFQALAVADLCLQREASSRPAISDVVSAMEYLANPSSENNQNIIPQKYSSSSLGYDNTSENKLRFDKENDEKGRSTNTSFDEGSHKRTWTANFSFDDETFQSLTSEVGSFGEGDM